MQKKAPKYSLKIHLLRAILIFRMRASEFYAYVAFYLFPQPNQTFAKVVIFGQGRTGSTLLESLLSSNRTFRARGEILSPAMTEVVWPMKYIEGRYKIEKSNFIFHLKLYQLTDKRKNQVNPRDFMLEMQKRGWKIIYLRRENQVMHAISNLVAQSRGGYHKFDDTEEQVKIKMDIEKFQLYVNNRILYGKIEAEILEELDFVEVVYEKDLENSAFHQQTADSVFQYLEMPLEEVKTSHKKVNTKTLRETFSNYDEFVGCLNANGWTHFLPSESPQRD